MSKDLGVQALNKIIDASSCKYQAGEMSKEDGMAIGEALIEVFFESRSEADSNPPTLEMCEAGKFLVASIANVEGC